MLGKRIINTATGAAPSSCTTDTVQILGDTSCVAYYKMSDATDETGSYDGTPTNVNFNIAGKFGNAGSFNGSSSVMTAPRSFSTSSAYSVSGWMNITSSAYTINCFYWQATGTNISGLYFESNGSGGYSINLEHKGQTNAAVRYTLPSQPTGFNHFVGTFDGSIGKIYMNGVEVASGNLDSKTDISNTIYIGGGYPYNNITYYRPVAGLDQVRIFDRAITANEVTTLYNEVYCQPTIVPTDHFEPVIYTGNNSSQSISTLDFQPDFTWIKSRDFSNRNHRLLDSVRGATKVISSDLTGAEYTELSLTSFDTNGFTLGSAGNQNNTSEDYVAWNWKAGGAAVAANSIEATNATRSANVDAGFSIIKFHTSASSASPPPMNYIEHGLDATPEMVIYKRTDSTQNWVVQSAYIQQGQSLALNLTNGVGANNATGFFDNTSTSIGVRSNFAISRDASYIAYCFHSVDGYQKIGSYTGTGALGNVINVGFKPRFLMWKKTNGAVGWFLLDGVRNTTDVWSARLEADNSGAEAGPDSYTVTVSNTGFEMTGSFATWTGSNELNSTYIYLAIA